jgi:hypothetical protein
MANPRERWKPVPYGPYKDPERVPMLLLIIGLMIVLVCFLVWAIQ